jgi:steroid delta-isomerase-like uncharacterized protein
MSERTEGNKEIVRRYQEAYNTGNLDVLEELLAPDWTTNAFPTAVLDQTIENAKLVHQMLLEAFPDLRITTDELIAEGDHVVQVWSLRATHKGEIIGLPPTGNRVETGGISVFQIKDGKIVRHHALNDMLDLISQMGGDPPPEWMTFAHKPQ